MQQVASLCHKNNNELMSTELVLFEKYSRGFAN